MAKVPAMCTWSSSAMPLRTFLGRQAHCGLLSEKSWHFSHYNVPSESKYAEFYWAMINRNKNPVLLPRAGLASPAWLAFLSDTLKPPSYTANPASVTSPKLSNTTSKLKFHQPNTSFPPIFLSRHPLPAAISARLHPGREVVASPRPLPPPRHRASLHRPRGHVAMSSRCSQDRKEEMSLSSLALGGAENN